MIDVINGQGLLISDEKWSSFQTVVIFDICSEYSTVHRTHIYTVGPLYAQQHAPNFHHHKHQHQAGGKFYTFDQEKECVKPASKRSLYCQIQGV